MKTHFVLTTLLTIGAASANAGCLDYFGTMQSKDGSFFEKFFGADNGVILETLYNSGKTMHFSLVKMKDHTLNYPNSVIGVESRVVIKAGPQGCQSYQTKIEINNGDVFCDSNGYPTGLSFFINLPNPKSPSDRKTNLCGMISSDGLYFDAPYYILSPKFDSKGMLIEHSTVPSDEFDSGQIGWRKRLVGQVKP